MMSDKLEIRSDLEPFSDPSQYDDQRPSRVAPIENSSSSVSDDAASTMQSLAQRLQGQSRRYLMQVSCALTPTERESDCYRSVLAQLANSIHTVGGQLEHHWGTPLEYELILVVRLQRHQISVETLTLALNALRLVRSLRTTPLFSLDEPEPCPPETARQDLSDEISNRDDRNAGEYHPDQLLIVDALASLSLNGT